MAPNSPLITITCLIQIRSRTHSPGCRPLHIPDNLHCCSWGSLAPPSPQVSQVPALSACSSEKMKPNPGHFAMTSKGADNFHARTHFILTSGTCFCPPTLHTARELPFRLIFLRQSQYSSFFLAGRVLIKYIQIFQQKIENAHHNTTLVFSSFSSYDIFVPGNLCSNNTENLAS